jgi:hypothetical protein
MENMCCTYRFVRHLRNWLRLSGADLGVQECSRATGGDVGEKSQEGTRETTYFEIRLISRGFVSNSR